MSREIVPSIELFRTQKTPKTDESLRIVYNALIQAYDTARQGHITDPKTLRLIARQFEAVADSPEASDFFPYDAGRAAAVLYNYALDIDMRDMSIVTEQASQVARDVDLEEPVSEAFQITTEGNNMTENTTEKIKLEESRVVGVTMAKEQSSEAKFEKYKKYLAPYTVWETLLKMAEEAEKSEPNYVEVKDLKADWLEIELEDIDVIDSGNTGE